MNNLLELKNVYYRYNQGSTNEVAALTNVSLAVHQHDYLGIIGNAGSGKSTLIKLLDGLLLPSQGQLLYKGQLVNGKKAIARLHRHVGMVFQYPEQQLFKHRVIDDVMFGCLNQGLTADQAADNAKTALLEVGLPEDCFTRSPFELSGGQMRKAAIAGIIAMRPEVLILDEPTAGLDPQAREQLFELLERLYQGGTTLILVSHELDDVAAHCRTTCLLDGGQVVVSDQTAAVFRRTAKLEALGIGLPQVTKISNQLANSLGIGETTTDYQSLLGNIIKYVEGN